MAGQEKEFLDILRGAVAKCRSGNIALSGGLDSSAIAWYMRDRRPNAYAVIAEDFVATDLTYCQMAAAAADIPLHMIRASTDDIVSSIEGTVKALGVFNDIEVRNALVMHILIKTLKECGEGSVITGDGADELFAGYGFLLKKTGEELEMELDRISKIMHFPSKAIGRSLGVSVETPFLDETVIEFAGELAAEHKVGNRRGARYGKMIIRRSLEGMIPDQIVWRKKSPMQDGAGTAGLTGLFDAMIPDEAFLKRREEIEQSDGVHIRTKESLHYYQTFRRFFDSPHGQGRDVCPDCRYRVGGSRFCRMCGRFPV